MKIAIVHDWLTWAGGAEVCLKEFIEMYPQADIFCMVDFLPQMDRDFLKGKLPKTSFIQKLPGARKWYRSYLPLMPIAVEQLDVTQYDLVISSTASVAKGVITGPDQLHVAYTYSPIRYAWDLQYQYLKESAITKGPKRWFASVILHYMRLWDTRTASGVDRYVAISRFISRRIKKTYGRTSSVIYPPVDIGRFSVVDKKEDFYLTISRMVPYKKIGLIVQAFQSMPEKKLVVIGDGPEMTSVRRLAGENVSILGRLSDTEVVSYLQRAKAFVFAAEEDFGIAPLEAQACGTPVVAYGKGGALETIRGTDEPGQTGVFFEEQTVASIVSAIAHLEQRQYAIDPQNCRENAERFSISRFRQEFESFVKEALAEHRGNIGDATSV